MKKYKNYIFDLYATLVDIRTDEYKDYLWKSMSEIYTRQGAEYSPDEMRDEYFRLVDEECQKTKLKIQTEYPEPAIEEVFKRLYTQKQTGTVSVDPEWLSLICSVFRTLSMEWLRLYPTTLSTLHMLKERSCNLYLLSNAQSAFTRPELDMLGLTGFFDDIFISSEHSIKKPDAAFLQKLIDKHNLPPNDTVMVGNEVEADMLLADRCGIPGILLNTAEQPTGVIKKAMSATGLSHPERITIIRSGNIAKVLDTESATPVTQKPATSEVFSWPENLIKEIGWEFTFGTDKPFSLSEDQVNGFEYAISQLDDRIQQIVLMRYRDNCTIASIAAVHAISVTRVSQLLKRAAFLLRKPELVPYYRDGYRKTEKRVLESKNTGTSWLSQDDLYKTSISDIGLPARVAGSLHRSGLYTVEDLVRLVQETPDGLYGIRNLGSKSINSIFKKLESLGINCNAAKIQACFEK